MKNLGDKIAAVATPIARALHLPCIDPATNQLNPESNCSKRREMLNQGQYAEAFFDVFWPQPKKKDQ